MSPTFEKGKDPYHLDNIFYNIYEIDSCGLRPQRRLVETLMSDVQTGFDHEAPYHSPSFWLKMDKVSNLFTGVTIAKIFDPSFYAESALVPGEYLGEDNEKLRVMRKDLQKLMRAGRSFTLRMLAGYPAGLDQKELTEEEARKIAERLRSRYGINSTSDSCIGFLTGKSAVESENLEETTLQLTKFWEITYDFWNNEGREERTLYHAAKLDLMNAITDATIRKAESLGLDPNMFTRNDEMHADYWRQVYNEDVPLPHVLLARSREVVDMARGKYQR
ncbi:MAG: hypothetical protein HY051_05850 [Candidatus Aenigmarchaeota archaeon]|nr:hypothetical protein [Candidatus Aenigmarchaeota archaeon]